MLSCRVCLSMGCSKGVVSGSPSGGFGRFVRNVLRERTVDLAGLSWSLRLLTLLGYASVASMLAVTLFLELSAAGSSGVEFKSNFSSKALLVVPVPALIFSGLSLAAGWAFVLTGATDCRRRVFLLIGGVFFVQWVLFVGRGGVATAFLGFAGLLLLAVVALMHLFSRRLRYWRAYALVEFSAWLILMLLVVAEMFLNNTRRVAALDLELALSVPQILTMPFWIVLGVEAVDVAAKLTRQVIAGLRSRFSDRRFGTLVVAVLLIRPVISFALILNDGGWWGIDLLVSLVLVLWAAGLRLSGRLSVRTLSLLLAISLVLPLLTLGWSQPFRETDLTTVVLSVAGVATNVLPAALLFVGLAAYDVLNFGVRYANVDGRIMPRGGRVLMYFGAVLLVTAYVLFFLNAREVGTGQTDESLNLLIDMPFMAGVLFLGLPYLAWMVWRRREWLIGSEIASARSGDVDG